MSYNIKKTCGLTTVICALNEYIIIGSDIYD